MSIRSFSGGHDCEEWRSVPEGATGELFGLGIVVVLTGGGYGM